MEHAFEFVEIFLLAFLLNQFVYMLFVKNQKLIFVYCDQNTE